MKKNQGLSFTLSVLFHTSVDCHRWHYDVKPENILVFSNRKTSPYDWQFKLTDFGLSLFKKTDHMEGEQMATEGHGTTMYGMSTAQKNSAPLDIRIVLTCDI
jgi:hypothetical protein